MAITGREHYMMAMNHEKPVRTPIELYDSVMVGFGGLPGPWFEKGPIGGGYDGFGVRWETPASGGGQPIPAPNEFIIDSEHIQDWKKIVKFPDVNDCDWEECVRMEMGDADRNKVVVQFGSGNGPFERLAALMGFEEALSAIYEEPEAVNELMEAIVDFKIQVIEKVAKYYKADYFTSYDDVATERGMFMSPQTYRDVIKGPTKRMFDAVKAYGMVPMQHTCGRAEDIIEDMIDTGTEAWTSVQPTNDIVSLLKKYGDKITIVGGFDTNGPAAQLHATDEEIVKEVYRTLDTYSPHGSFIFLGYKLANSLDPMDFMNESMRVVGPAVQYAEYKAAMA